MENTEMLPVQRKAVFLDLIVDELKKAFSETIYTKAYDDIRNFMSENGLEHRQGSVYFSISPLPASDLADIIEFILYSIASGCPVAVHLLGFLPVFLFNLIYAQF